jgi:lipopolysaccharide/colanic/teichoic acid biosynthesis glycosyltransferase
MGKRLFDLAGSLFLLAALSPLLLLVALAVWLDSGRPILFSQLRVGRRFRLFRIWKFRSMRTDLAGAPITAAGDPRVTRVGRLLRAAKLDELPQLFNVLRGEMSLVGPRPELPEYVELFRERYARILRVRPGITDLASLAYSREEARLGAALDPHYAYVAELLPRKLDLAEEYLRKRSAWLDLTILFRTLFVALRA